MLAAVLIPALSSAAVAFTLGRENFWIDELSSLYFSDPVHSFSDLVSRIWPTETNPPLYYLYLYGWRQFFPFSGEVSVRAASLVPAVLACLSPLLYSSGTMAHDRRIAVVLLLSSSPGVLYYAAEARGYALLTFFSINVFFLYLATWKDLRSGFGAPARNAVLTGVMSVLASWTHFFGMILAASVFSVLMTTALLRRQSIVLIGCVTFVTALATTFWTGVQLSYMRTIAEQHWFVSMTWHDLIDAAKTVAFLAFGYKWSVVLIAGTTAICLVSGLRMPLSNKEAFLLPVAIFFVLTMALSFYVPLVFPRYFMAVLPAIYMLVAESLGDALGRVSTSTERSYLSLILVFVGSMVVSWPLFAEPDREDWRRPAEIVNRTTACRGATILVVAPAPDAGDPAYLYGHYLDPRHDIRLTPVRVDDLAAPSTWLAMAQSPCPVKVWGGHLEAWQMSQVLTTLQRHDADYKMLAIRRGFLWVPKAFEPPARKP